MLNSVKLTKIDILFISFLILFSVYFYMHITMIVNPTIDGADYLLNAHGWLSNEPLYAPFRPPLISWVIAGIWLITNESWIVIQYLLPAFTLAAGVTLYALLRKQKGELFAFGVSALTLVNQIVFFWGMQIQTESLSLFFLILSLFLLKSEKEKHWYLAGVAIGLTFASRYPVFVPALTILIAESVIQRNSKLVKKAIITCVPVIAIVIISVFLKTDAFSGAFERDTQFTFLLSPFYILHSVHTWSLVVILVPIAFLFRRTYSDKNNYTYIAWFLVSLLFWSANTTNFQERFMIHSTPAVYYLSMIAIENFTKINISKVSLSRVRRHFVGKDSRRK